MGPNAARKAKVILKNTMYVLAIEAMVASQALEFRKPLKPGRGPRLLYEKVREVVPPLEKDRYLHHDIEKITSMIQSGELHQALEKVFKS